jgi:hypothetical protein
MNGLVSCLIPSGSGDSELCLPESTVFGFEQL